MTHTNPLFRLYYIGAKSLFWFLFFEIEHVNQSCPPTLLYVTLNCVWDMPQSETSNERHEKPAKTEM